MFKYAIIFVFLIFLAYYIIDKVRVQISGTENQINVLKDKDDNIILALPQNIDIEASPRFDGIKFNDPSSKFSTTIKGSSSIQDSNLTLYLPSEMGNVNQVLKLRNVMGTIGDLEWGSGDNIQNNVSSGLSGKTSLNQYSLLRGNGIEPILDDNNITFDGTSLSIGGNKIIDGTSLKNITSIDNTTKNTIESTIDSLLNLIALGTISSGTWNGNIIEPLYGGTGVSSLSSIASLSGLSEVGTLSSGTWNGNVISSLYGGTGVSSLSSITSLSGLSEVGTLSSGIWNGSVINPLYGGTGLSSIGLNYIPRGNGTSALTANSNFSFDGNTLSISSSTSSIPSCIKLYEKSSSGTNSVSIKPQDMASDYNIILPSGIGSTNQSMIVSNISGNDVTLGFGNPQFTAMTITSDPNPALAGGIYFCDTSSAAFSITLPTSPPVGSIIEFIDASGTFGTNNLTINRGGSDIININMDTTSRTSILVYYNNMRIKAFYKPGGKWGIYFEQGNSVKFAILYDKKALGTDGGASNNAGNPSQRIINIKEDPDNFVTLPGITGTGGTNNSFIIGPGQFLIEASSPAYEADQYKLDLFSGTNTLEAAGTSENAAAGDFTATRSYVSKLVNISTATTYFLKHFIRTSNARGLGFSTNVGTTVDNTIGSYEVYTTVKITKYDNPVTSGVVSLMGTYNRLTINSDTNPLIANTIYSCDTTSTSFAVTLPSSITVGDYIELIDCAGYFNVNNLTINASGMYMFVNNNTSGTNILIISTSNTKIKCTYVASNRWYIEYPNFIGMKVARVRDSKNASTDGGPATAGVWNLRTLTTLTGDTDFISLNTSNNRITLAPGRYSLSGSAPVNGTINSHQAALVNLTTGVYTYGTMEVISTSGNLHSRSFINTSFSIGTATSFEIRHVVQTNVADSLRFGLKYGGTQPTPPTENNYTDITIVKYDEPISSGIVSVLPSSYINKISITNTLTLSLNTYYYIASNASPYNIYLPSSPSLGDIIKIVDGTGALSTNAVTLLCANSNHNIYVGDSNQTSFVLRQNGMKVEAEYTSTNRWLLSFISQEGVWKTFTMTIGSTGTPPIKATVVSGTTVDCAQYTLIGKTLHVRYDYWQPNCTGANVGTGDYTFPLPSGYIIDTSKVYPDTSSQQKSFIGNGFANYPGVAGYMVFVCIGDSTGTFVKLTYQPNVQFYLGANTNTAGRGLVNTASTSNGVSINFQYSVPIL